VWREPFVEVASTITGPASLPYALHHRFLDPAVAQAECDQLLLQRMEAVRLALGRPILVGLCGAQGSGKSTTAARLSGLLRDQGLRAVVLSIDDVYLTWVERLELARTVHPLLATRGVPGTHDLALAHETLNALLNAGPDTRTALPAFDKAFDDRLARAQWPIIAGPLDVVLFEGWCVGCRPQPREALEPPINALERAEDPHGVWRAYVNAQLAGAYGALFARLDLRLFLAAPGFDAVHAWRAQQEAGLARGPNAPPPMDDAALGRFIAHYERLTRWLLEDRPADVVVELGYDRTPMAWR
jgi:D-glycerate 3-kinase